MRYEPETLGLQRKGTAARKWVMECRNLVRVE